MISYLMILIDSFKIQIGQSLLPNPVAISCVDLMGVLTPRGMTSTDLPSHDAYQYCRMCGMATESLTDLFLFTQQHEEYNEEETETVDYGVPSKTSESLNENAVQTLDVGFIVASLSDKVNAPL
jgi:hypothetical protein